MQYATGVEGITRKATREVRARLVVASDAHSVLFDSGLLWGWFLSPWSLFLRIMSCRLQIYTASRIASRQALALTDRLVLLTHNLTDVGQWPRVQCATQTALAVLAALGGRRYATSLAARLQLATRPALASLPWRAAAARQVAGGAGAGAAAAPSAGFRSAGSSIDLFRAATRPLPRVRVAGAAGAGAAAVAAANEASLLGSIGESLRNTGAVLKAATLRATSAAVAAAAVGATRVRSSAIASRRPLRAPPSQAPTRRRQLRRAGLLVLGSTC